MMRHFCTLHGWDAAKPCVHCAADGPTREDLLRRAIVASVSADVSEIDELFTPTAMGSSPATAARSREELIAEIEARRGALSHERVTSGAPRATAQSYGWSGRRRPCTPGRSRCTAPAQSWSRRD